MLIGGLIKTSLIDYPNKIAAVIFTTGCNLNCPYCHNPELVIPDIIHYISEDALFSFLKTRKDKLDGVVITGGEPTVHKDLIEFIKKIKDEGFSVKLDTNGTNPSVLKRLIGQKLVDYIAMDIKAPFDEYQNIVTKNVDIEKIKSSFDIIVNSEIDYEFRTTVVYSLLNYDSFVKINNMFKQKGRIKRYYLQRFQKSKHLDEKFLEARTFDETEFEKLKKLFEESTDFFMVR